MTKQSKWTIPDELKVFFLLYFCDINIVLIDNYFIATIFFIQAARELAEKASNQQSDRETGTNAASEPSTIPANQSSTAVGLIAPSAHDASANSVPPGASASHNVDNTSSSSTVGKQNGGPNTRAVPVTTSTEVQLVATDAGTNRFVQTFTIFQSCNYYT